MHDDLSEPDQRAAQTEIGAKALTYLKEQLRRRGPLARLLEDRISTTSGRTVALHPASCVVDDDTEFSWAILPAERREGWVKVRSLKGSLAELVRDYLAVDGDRVCVFEDAEAGPDDPYLERLQTRVLRALGSVYYVALRDDDLGKIEVAVGTAPFWSTVGALSTAPSTASAARQASPGTPELAEVATRASTVVLGAFDGEGYLLWQSMQ